MSARRAVSLGFALVCVFAATCVHAGIEVGAGSSLAIGDGLLDLGCSDLIVAGSAAGSSGSVAGIANLSVAAGGMLAPGAGQITLGGNFSDAGTFTPGTSAVAIIDACGNGTSSVSGATNFHDLLISTATGKQLVLPATLTQSIAHALTLQGAAGNLLQVLSSSAGQQALLNVNAAAAQSIAYVNARDDKASGATIAPGAAATYNSVDSGDLTNWFTGAVIGPGGGAAPIPTPMLNRWTAWLLAVLLAALARKQSRAS